MRYAQIKDGRVENVIVADEGFAKLMVELGYEMVAVYGPGEPEIDGAVYSADCQTGSGWDGKTFVRGPSVELGQDASIDLRVLEKLVELGVVTRDKAGLPPKR